MLLRYYKAFFLTHSWDSCQADAKYKVKHERLAWPETPHALEPTLPAECEKIVFHLFRSSASGKPHITFHYFVNLEPNPCKS